MSCLEGAGLVQPFDPGSLAYPWVHDDPAVDTLQREVLALAARAVADGVRRAEQFFDELWALAPG